MNPVQILKMRLFWLGWFLFAMGWLPEMQAAISKQNPYMFRHITTQDGLTSNSITSLFRDSRGFLWVGTSAGLSRYDSYNFLTFKEEEIRKNSSNILDIFEDWNGHIWVESGNGYSFFDYGTDKFSDDHQAFLKGIHIVTDTIYKMGVCQKKDILWAYDNQSLFVYRKSQDVTKKINIGNAPISDACQWNEYLFLMSSNGNLRAVNTNSFSVADIDIPNWIRPILDGQSPKLFVDGNGGIWMHTLNHGRVFYKKNHGTEWEEIHLTTEQSLFNRVQDIKEDNDGNIWIITSHQGGFVLKPGSPIIQQITHNPLQPQTVSSNNLTAICIDKDGIVWLGSFKKGISFYSPQAQVFMSYRIMPNSDVISFLEENGNIWLGTDGNGLLQQNATTEQPQSVNIQANIIQTIKKDELDNLWIGTFQNGIIKYHEGKVEKFTAENSDLASDIIYGLEPDMNGTLWIATLDGSIQKMDIKTGKIEKTCSNPYNIRDIIYDGAKTIYAATSRGLVAFDTETLKSELLVKTSTFIVDLLKDHKNNIWMASSQGLTFYNTETRETKILTTADGLSANNVTAIAEDDNQQLWVGTANGVNRLKWDTKAFKIVHYYQADGIASNNINERAIYKQSNGNLMIGTPYGYTIAIPQNIVSNTYNAKVHLTELDSPIPSIWGLMHRQSMENIDDIQLPEGQTSVVARFSTLDFTNNGQTFYYLRVNGRNWTKLDGNELRTTWLPEGDYKLEVSACDMDGNFSSYTRTFTVHVTPPFYRTRWAYFTYILLIILLLAGIQWNYRNHKRRKMQKEAIEKEAEHQKKVMDMKLQFFANVSHELRTPLTLIINPLEEFLNKNPQYQNSLLSTVSQNSKYLLELINQLLDFRKLDAGGESISYMHCDIAALIHDQFLAFESMAVNRNITYTFNTEKAVIMMDCDYDKIRKVALNILSNAFKFTPNGGCISVNLHLEGQNLVLCFKDNGCGIDAEKRDKIFNCFYQIESQDHSQGGSGIGLYLVKQYVDLHHGTIRVEDNIPQGTIFTISLPLRLSMSNAVAKEVEETESLVKEEGEEKENYTILVVDDNMEFLSFLAASISTQYNVLKATNGKEALQLVTQENVDMVISDVMMPVMDGLQLCQAIKSDIKTSHIPVILLTARVGDEYQIEGLNNGADDYITKPFSMEILKLRVKKMLENSLNRQEQFEREVKIEPSKITITPLDQQFIQKAIQVVEEHLENPEFSVEMLAEQMSLSRGHLYKKLSKITGKNPIDFIRLIRLKRAQQLLQESQLQISEIAYKLGYNSPKLFTKHFKEAFDMTPSEYAALWKQQ